MKTNPIKKTIHILLVILMAWISLPHEYGFAAMISTESAATYLRGRQARAHIQSVLAREEVKTLLIRQGIPMDEAKNRINSLTDAEAILLSDKIDNLPAGGDVWTALVVASLVVFIILLVTDIAGYTDVFPFVKKVN